MSRLGPNPIACARCNREVAPERLQLPAALADAVADWRGFHDCFYLLWLDSGEYEDWSLRILSNPTSPVNTRGLSLRAELDLLRRTYFGWFRETATATVEPLSVCPVCSRVLEDRGLVGRVCERCSVLRMG
jgi:hypothetical protein